MSEKKTVSRLELRIPLPVGISILNLYSRMIETIVLAVMRALEPGTNWRVMVNYEGYKAVLVSVYAVEELS